MTTTLPLDLAALTLARERIADAVIRTVQWQNDPLSEELGVSLQLKLENLQRTGSFKIRAPPTRSAGSWPESIRPQVSSPPRPATMRKAWRVPRPWRVCARWS